jgi:hypothetical protein
MLVPTDWLLEPASIMDVDMIISLTAVGAGGVVPPVASKITRPLTVIPGCSVTVMPLTSRPLTVRGVEPHKSITGAAGLAPGPAADGLPA